MTDLSCSFEYFPPAQEAEARALYQVGAELAGLGPDFFSVTFGAGGGTRVKTLKTVKELRQRTGIEGAPHISCVGSSRRSLLQTLRRYRQEQIRRVVVLRGDRPSGAVHSGELQHAEQLVSLIRRESGDFFRVEVAAHPEFHPESASAASDLEYFKRKVEAGADGAITQYFYNPESYFRFLDSCERLGVKIPIVPGIMPITNFTQWARFSKNCGADIPRWLLWRLQDLASDLPSLYAFGIEVLCELCERLLRGGAPGLHFYTMNRSPASIAIWRQLGLDQRQRQVSASLPQARQR